MFKKIFNDKSSLYIVLLGILSIIFDNSLISQKLPLLTVLTNTIDHIILVLFSYEVFSPFFIKKAKKPLIKDNIFNYIFYFCFLILFIYNKYFLVLTQENLANISIQVILFRYLFISLKLATRINKLNAYLNNFIKNPAQTVILSFFILIISGTILLMLPISTADNTNLGFVDSFFTATSAVCVTGLVVVDTATRFSFFGQLVIMILIQMGGLGIMILSSFAVFILGRKISFQEKKTVAMLLNKNDVNSLKKILSYIVALTILFETTGALFLYRAFAKQHLVSGGKLIFMSIFHAISAFCNAGFALFSNSLENYTSNSAILFIISGLIIFGGLGFGVIINIKDFLKSKTLHLLKKQATNGKLTTNSIMVLLITIFLIFSGMLIIYALEHKYSLLQYPLGTQYLAAFFQSVTLRTAGFNSINFSSLQVSTCLLMMLWMFIGGASGSTAGGIKVNSVGILFAYFKSVFQNKTETTIFNRTIPRRTVSQVLLLITISIVIVFCGIFMLSIFEEKSLINLAFEVISAFGTVGLSTGITSSLSFFGKITIIALMFIGRLGPLTIIMALSRDKTHPDIRYPEANLAIG